MKLHLACAAAILASGAALADTMVIDNVTLIDGTGQPPQSGHVGGDRRRSIRCGHAHRRRRQPQGRRIDGRGGG